MAYAAADEVFVPLLRNAAAPHQSPSVTASPLGRFKPFLILKTRK